MQRLVLSFILVGLIWAIGLALFVARIPAVSETKSSTGDAIVVYTGGRARLTTAMSLFTDGQEQRLLISGVHPDTSRAQLAELWVGDPARFECCVDLGHSAQTTDGNAAELAQWAQQHGFRRIVLVTSDYHMPRAMAVTARGAPDVEIVPHVVGSGYLDEGGRPASTNAWRVLAGEYTKFLLARGKGFITSIIG